MPEYKRLIGIVNRAGYTRGFAIPVFAEGADLYLQRIDKQHKIREFIKTTLAETQIKRFDTRVRRRIGSDAVFAFDLRSSILHGSRKDLAQKIDAYRKILSHDQHPFLLVDIADFLGNANLKIQAKALAMQMLQREYPDRASDLAAMQIWPDDAPKDLEQPKKIDIPHRKVKAVPFISITPVRQKASSLRNSTAERRSQRRHKRINTTRPGLSSIRSNDKPRAGRSPGTSKGMKRRLV